MTNLSQYRQLYRELVKQNKRLYKIHSKDNEKKNQALLNYHRIQLIKEKKSLEEIDKIIKIRENQLLLQLEKEKLKSKYINSLGINLREFIDNENHQVGYIVENFLKSQRNYMELIERYNPGSTMSQEERVEKTANRVGLSVPESKY